MSDNLTFPYDHVYRPTSSLFVVYVKVRHSSAIERVAAARAERGGDDG